MDSNELRAKVEALRAARKPQEWWKNLTLTDYERGRESAKWDIENDPEGFVICFDFPHLAAVLGAEFSRASLTMTTDAKEIKLERTPVDKLTANTYKGDNK